MAFANSFSFHEKAMQGNFSSNVERISGEEFLKISRHSMNTISRTKRHKNVWYRKKTIGIEGSDSIPLLEEAFQNSIREMTQHHELPSGLAGISCWKEQDFWSLVQPWFEGLALCDIQKNIRNGDREQKQSRLQKKWLLWQSAFEALQIWHNHGFIHGNLKPNNIIIEEKQNDGYVVHLLDGGILSEFSLTEHVFGSKQIKNLVKSSKFEKLARDAKESQATHFWKSPEQLGFCRRALAFQSDVFSLTLCMLWDFGMLSSEILPVCHFKAEEQNFLPPDYFRKKVNANSVNLGFENLPIAYLGIWPQLLSPLMYTESKHVAEGIFLFGEWIWASKDDPVFDTLDKFRKLIQKILWDRDLNAESIAQHLGNFSKNQKAKNGLDVFFAASNAEFFLKNDPLNQVKIRQRWIFDDTFLSFLIPKSNRDDSSYLGSNVHANKDKGNSVSFEQLTLGFLFLGKPSIHLNFSGQVCSRVPYLAINEFLLQLMKLLEKSQLELGADWQTLIGPHRSVLENLLFHFPDLVDFFGLGANFYDKGQQSLDEYVLAERHELFQVALTQVLLKIIELSQVELLCIERFEDIDASSQSILKLLEGRTKNTHLKWFFGSSEPAEYNSKVLNGLSSLSFEESQTLGFLAFMSESGRLSFSDLETLKVTLENHPELMSKTSTLDRNLRMTSKDFLGVTYADLIVSENTNHNRKWDFKNLTHTIQHACYRGILVPQERKSTGELWSFTFHDSLVHLALLNRISTEQKQAFGKLLIHKFYSDFLFDSANFNELVQVLEFLSACPLDEVAHASYVLALSMFERTSTEDSARYVTEIFEKLERKLEYSECDERVALVPRIREHLAILYRLLEETKKSQIYFASVAFDIGNKKRQVILQMQSFPSVTKEPMHSACEKNNLYHSEEISLSHKFNAIIQAAQDSYLVPGMSLSGTTWDENSIAVFVLQRLDTIKQKVDAKVSVQKSRRMIGNFLGIAVDQSLKSEEMLPYQPRRNSLREQVFSTFLRESLGTVDARLIAINCARAIEISVSTGQVASGISAAITLLVACDRIIKKDVRTLLVDLLLSLALDFHLESTRIDLILLKVWQTFFFDGKLDEARKLLLNLSFSKEFLPQSQRFILDRFQFLVDKETSTVENALPWREGRFSSISGVESLQTWEVGQLLYGGSRSLSPLRPSRYPSLVASILSEKTDQILLNTFYCTEGGQPNPISRVSQNINKSGLRNWLSYGSKTLDYLPNSLGFEWQSQAQLDFWNESDQSVRSLKIKDLLKLETQSMPVFKREPLNPRKASSEKQDEEKSKNSSKSSSSLTSDEELKRQLQLQYVMKSSDWASSRDFSLELKLRYSSFLNLEMEQRHILVQICKKLKFFHLAKRLQFKNPLVQSDLLLDKSDEIAPYSRAIAKILTHLVSENTPSNLGFFDLRGESLDSYIKSLGVDVETGDEVFLQILKRSLVEASIKLNPLRGEGNDSK